MSNKQKISDWLGENLGSHDIVNHAKFGCAFLGATGIAPCWPTHTESQTLQAIENRGLGGSLQREGAVCAWGYEIAASLARKYAPNYKRTKVGRGWIFWEALDALREAGH